MAGGRPSQIFQGVISPTRTPGSFAGGETLLHPAYAFQRDKESEPDTSDSKLVCCLADGTRCGSPYTT